MSSSFARRAARVPAVAVVLLFAAGGPAASARTVRVDNDNVQCPTTRFRSISAALAFVAPGDTVLVCPGTYFETLRMDKPGVSVTGVTGRRQDVQLVFPAPGVAAATDVLVEMSAPATTLDSVSLRDRSPRSPNWTCFTFGVLVDNGLGDFAEASIIHNVSVRQSPHLDFDNGFSCSSGNAIEIGQDTAPGAGGTTPGRAIVRDSRIVARTTGVNVNAASTAVIDHNVIPGLSGGSARGIAVNAPPKSPAPSARIQRNNISGASVGVFARVGKVTIGGAGVGNVIHDTGFGLEIDDRGAAVVDNDIHHNALVALFLSSSRAVVSGNRIHDNAQAGLFVTGGANILVGNVAINNGMVPPTTDFGASDCADLSTGTGTAGTANTWITNIGVTSSPPGICLPPGT